MVPLPAVQLSPPNYRNISHRERSRDASGRLTDWRFTKQVLAQNRTSLWSSSVDDRVFALVNISEKLILSIACWAQ